MVAQPIIESFQLTDVGLVIRAALRHFLRGDGPAHCALGRSFQQVHIISLCIVLWSIMTALCGVAIGFFTLLLFRIGVAIGEAGCTPPANSLIGDYFIAQSAPPHWGCTPWA